MKLEKSKNIIKLTRNTTRFHEYSNSLENFHNMLNKQIPSGPKYEFKQINSFDLFNKFHEQTIKQFEFFKNSAAQKAFEESQKQYKSAAALISKQFDFLDPINSIDFENVTKEIQAEFETVGVNEYRLDIAKGNQKNISVPELIKPIKRIIKDIYLDSDVLHSIGPRRFEEVVAELLHKQGYQVELTNQTRDGGYDIIALSKIGRQEYKMLVECKRNKETRKVGVEVIRSFCDVLNTENANKGMVVTTSTFSKPSIQRSSSMGYRLDLVNRFELLNWASEYLIEKQDYL